MNIFSQIILFELWIFFCSLCITFTFWNILLKNSGRIVSKIILVLSFIILLQILHGFTFGAAHLGAMAFLTKHVPKEISATGQSLYYTLIGGIFSGCMLPLAGKLYSDLSGSAFFIMSCFAGCSLISLLVLSRIVRHDFKASKGWTG